MNQRSSPILVTGAAGKSGLAVVRALVRRGCAVRAAVRRESQRAALETLGAHETVAMDLKDAQAFEEITQGVRAIYHICPNVHPQELQIGHNAIRAAKQGGIDHFVYHSVLWPQVEAMSHHWQKMRVEEALIESGLPFTFLQPCAYMQNTLGQTGNMIQQGVIEVPYRLEARFSLVDLEDVAEAAAVVLTESGHKAAAYTCCGPERVNSKKMAKCFAEMLGMPVQAVRISQADWLARNRGNRQPGYRGDALLKMFDYYDQKDFVGSAAPLAGLLKRPPGNFDGFVRRAVRNFQNSSSKETK